jgi:hypothetical protein
VPSGERWVHEIKFNGYGSAILDGEVVVPSLDGTTDFSVLQNELKGRSTKFVMVALDLLYLNGYDLGKITLLAAQGGAQEADRGDRYPVQLKFRGRWGDI